MPDLIDAFVVSLGIDASQYNREIKNYRDDQRRLREEQTKGNREQEDAQKRLTSGVRSMRNEVAGFVTLLAGATGIQQFASNILTTDAATGRFASNMGIATERVGAWEEAIKRAGGTAQEGRAAISTMVQAFQNLQLTGTSGMDADLKGLGIAKLTGDPEEMLLRISEASSRIPAAEFTARLQRMGFSEASITLLAKGRGELERLLVQMEKQGVANAAAAETSIAFDNSMNDIAQTLKAKARPAVDAFAKALTALLDDQESLNIATNIGVGLLAAIAISAGIAYAPFIALAGALTLVAAGFDTSNSAMKNWSDTFAALKKIWAGEEGGWGDLWTEFKSQGQEVLDDINEFAGTPDRSGRKGRIAARERADAKGSTGGGGAFRGGGYSGTPTQGTGGDILSFFKSRGYTNAQAQGITAGIMAESGGSHTARNPTSGAYGLGQHLSADRRANFKKRYGVDITKSTRQQQLDFIDWELKGGDFGGAAVRAQSTAAGTLNAYIRKFMRPAAGAETWGDIRRGTAWLNGQGVRGGGGGASTVNNTTNVGQVVIHTAATDANGIARDMQGALAKRSMATQANTGLQP